MKSPKDQKNCVTYIDFTCYLQQSGIDHTKVIRSLLLFLLLINEFCTYTEALIRLKLLRVCCVCVCVCVCITNFTEIAIKIAPH